MPPVFFFIFEIKEEILTSCHQVQIFKWWNMFWTLKMKSEQKLNKIACGKTFKLSTSIQIQVNMPGILTLAAWHQKASSEFSRESNFTLPWYKMDDSVLWAKCAGIYCSIIQQFTILFLYIIYQEQNLQVLCGQYPFQDAKLTNPNKSWIHCISTAL